MGNDNIAFRSSVGGYNKKDVYKYLDNLNREIISRDEASKEKITTLKKDNSALCSELEKARCELALLSEQKDKEIEKLKGDNAELLSDIEQKEAEIASLMSSTVELKQNAEAYKAQLEQKDTLIEELDSAAVKISLELDKLSEQYSKLCLEYSELARSFDGIDELKKKAAAYDKISARIKSQPHKATHEAQSSGTAAVKDDIDSMLSASAEEMLTYIKTTQSRFIAAIENAQNETAALKSRIDSVINSSKDKILETINNSHKNL